MKAVKTTNFVKNITKMGYMENKGNGSSHRIFKKKNSLPLSIPNSREIAPGTLRGLLKLIKLTSPCGEHSNSSHEIYIYNDREIRKSDVETADNFYFQYLKNKE